jgi:hypothetical protein
VLSRETILASNGESFSRVLIGNVLITTGGCDKVGAETTSDDGGDSSDGASLPSVCGVGDDSSTTLVGTLISSVGDVLITHGGGVGNSFLTT